MSNMQTMISNMLNFYQLKSDEMEHCQMPFVRDHMWKDYLEAKREFLILLPLDVILQYESLEMHLALYHYDDLDNPYAFLWVHDTLNGYTYWYKYQNRMYKCLSTPFNMYQDNGKKIKWYKTWNGITKRIIKEFGGVVYCKPIIYKEFFDGKVYKPTF